MKLWGQKKTPHFLQCTCEFHYMWKAVFSCRSQYCLEEVEWGGRWRWKARVYFLWPVKLKHTDVMPLATEWTKKKVGSSSGVKGKALENKLKTFATNWQSHLSSIYVLCFKVGQEFPTPHTSNFLSLPLKKNTDKNEKK